MSLDTTIYERRMESFRDKMKECGISGAYVFPGDDLAYLTGVAMKNSPIPQTSMLGLVVPVGSSPVLIVPERRVKYFQRTTWIEDVQAWAFPGDPFSKVGDVLRSRGLLSGRLGVISGMWWRDAVGLEAQVPQLGLVNVSPVLQGMRARKGPEEIEVLRECGRIAVQAMEDAYRVIAPNVSEATVAAEMYKTVISAGAVPGTMCVISGEHRVPEVASTKRIDTGDVILLFPKFSYKGYYADITRSAVLGTKDARLKAIEKAFAKTKTAGEAAAKPGVRFDAIDQICRDVMAAEGFGDYVVHGIGHGLGISTHEEPFIASGTPLQEGMVFSLEPHVVIPGAFGLRIEDTYVVTPSGGRWITEHPTEIVEL